MCADKYLIIFGLPRYRIGFRKPMGQIISYRAKTRCNKRLESLIIIKLNQNI